MDFSKHILSKEILDITPKIMDFIRCEMRTQAIEQLTIPQFRILNKISKTESQSHKNLSEWMGITPATLTRTIDILYLRGLLRRKITVEDKRQVAIKITPLGKSMIETYRNKVQSKLDIRLQLLDASEANSILEACIILKKIFK